MIHKLLTVALLLPVAASAAAARPAAQKIYHTRPANPHAPVIDGRLDDPA
ncbi:MAG: hypothetical protein ONB48_03705 [candidate division KSB1 bacterium]|nr:hypothetical protein [candidate division KSB1 bacterium]MDZ7274584.1 hypothetical protein [candidate division KSB1 bacterium]MDZ7284755.1 hypothetical protein [candidate division KSB1 bacterium]MDZ7297825.1 hypothetical protein [candidate division KSB1 bacterium]MDZ7307789.1 hypothetical protein [candidate division KSB1 bacterium]